MRNKIGYLIICVLFIRIQVFGQKRPLDYESLKKWTNIVESSVMFTSDGQYISYRIMEGERDRCVIQEVDSNKKIILENCFGYFLSDCRKFIFKNSGDSLEVLDLRTGNIKFISKIRNFSLPGPGEIKAEWLDYRNVDSEKDLTLLNLHTNEELRFENVDEYLFNNDYSGLVFYQKGGLNSEYSGKVAWVSFKDRRIRTIALGLRAEHFVFSNNNTQLAFIAKRLINGHFSSTVGYYRQGSDSASNLMEHCELMRPHLNALDITPSFSLNGEQLFFSTTFRNSEAESRIRTNINVVVKGPNDDSLPFLNTSGKSYQTVINLEDSLKEPIVLNKNEDGEWAYYYHSPDGKWLIAGIDAVGNTKDYKWNIAARPNLCLIRTADGFRTLIQSRAIITDITFSPDSRWIIWYDLEKGQYFSYDLTSGNLKVISGTIKAPIKRESDYPDFASNEGIGGWIKNQRSLLIYDRNDMWLVDPSGTVPSKNITHRFGIRNEIRFRVVQVNGINESSRQNTDTLLLSGFNMKTKFDDFYTLDVATEVLKKISTSDNLYTYGGFANYIGASSRPLPILRAKCQNIFVVSKMSPTEFPNLYITRDFKEFKKITCFSPQSTFNWYTTELICWKRQDGITEEGILYKPENFNPNLKYPVIYYYYERNSLTLNYYINPTLSNCVINIPWYVSNGYLVVVPDIHYIKGYPGKSAYMSVTSAARFMSAKPWVDSKRMGIQGHSFGGFETNYIVTHTSMFRAASMGAGISNMTSAYLQDWNWDGTWYFEIAQQRIGFTIWQRPDLYLENSAIFLADKIRTPLLIMQNQLDPAVLYTQGAELYNALRRLHKKAWFLNYQDEGHTLEKEENKFDFSKRLQQFFDHYLKDKPAPKWMTKGVAQNSIYGEFEINFNDNRPE